MNAQLLKFPCEFTIKVMGINHGNLITHVVDTMKTHILDFNQDTNLSYRLSKKNNYIAISVNFTAKSQTHLDNIYINLNKHQLVKMVL